MHDDAHDPAAHGRVPAALSLLVMSPAGASTIAVPERGVLVLGRSPECDVHIADAKLSRRHAELRAGDQIELVDLGSLNGTFLREERLAANTPARVVVGDSISIGSTVLVLQRAARGGERPRHIWTHGYLEARLEEECNRAARGGAPFALARMRVEPEGDASEAQGPTKAATEGTTAGVLASWLLDSDIIAKYAPHEYEILFVDTHAELADARAREIADKLGAAGVAFQIAVAAYPRDGRTPESLVEHTTRRLRGARDVPVDAPPSAVVAQGALERMDRMVQRVAASAINVLILGETGVGKEVLARRIHALSPRAGRPMLTLNCAALSESLLESELFGYEKAAFTGATQAKPGLLESANGGTIFLDEVGEMPLAIQAKLLRVLEQREVLRVGALRPRAIDVRFLAATNVDLEQAIAEGRFRRDLFFRLEGVPLSLPPLRDRVDEIEALTRAFIEQACRAMGRARPMHVSPEALEVLKGYEWPGNIRELRNVVERAVLLCSGDTITKEHLPLEKLGPVLKPPGARTNPPPAPAPRAGAPAPPNLPPPSRPTLPEIVDVEYVGAGDERQRIAAALEKCGGNQSLAAKLLGISRGTLIKRIEEFGLPRPRKREG